VTDSLSVSGRRKLLEAAKNVDDFTTFAIDNCTELQRHLRLNHGDDQDDDAETGDEKEEEEEEEEDGDDGDERPRRQSCCDLDVPHERQLVDCRQRRSYDVHRCRRGSTTSPQRQTSTDG